MALNPPIRDWQGKTAWVIGASSGIGLALAQALHRQGARVVVSARSQSALDAFVQAQPGALALPLDVTDRDALAQAAGHPALVAVDLVCYCSGRYRPMRATDIDLDEALMQHNTNLVGAWHMLKAVIPTLLARGQGHISLVSSVAGYRGLPRSLAYGPTKAALNNLAEALYLDLNPHGIGVSVVCPGFVDTPATATNDFTMPALITSDQAAQAMLAGWAAGDFHIHFPKRFTRVMKALCFLPQQAYFAAVRRFTGL